MVSTNVPQFADACVVIVPNHVVAEVDMLRPLECHWIVGQTHLHLVINMGMRWKCNLHNLAPEVVEPRTVLPRVWNNIVRNVHGRRINNWLSSHHVQHAHGVKNLSKTRDQLSTLPNQSQSIWTCSHYGQSSGDQVKGRPWKHACGSVQE